MRVEALGRTRFREGANIRGAYAQMDGFFATACVLLQVEFDKCLTWSTQFVGLGTAAIDITIGASQDWKRTQSFTMLPVFMLSRSRMSRSSMWRSRKGGLSHKPFNIDVPLVFRPWDVVDHVNS